MNGAKIFMIGNTMKIALKMIPKDQLQVSTGYCEEVLGAVGQGIAVFPIDILKIQMMEIMIVGFVSYFQFLKSAFV